MLIIAADDKRDKSGSTLCRAELEIKDYFSKPENDFKEKKKVHNIFF